MDVVYLFKESTENDSAELRYSLRSLRNLAFEKVVIVGEKPAWIKNVHHISVEQSGLKSANVRKSMTAALIDDGISDDFIMMNDDFFIMKYYQEIPTLHWGDMKSLIERYDARYPAGSEYIRRMKTLYHILVENHLQTLSYELHTPMVINRYKARQLYERAGKNSLYQFRTYYGNYHGVGGSKTEDVKVFLDSRHNNSLYNDRPMAYLQEQHFLSTTGGAFARGVAGEYVRSSFPDKSIYEI